MAASMIARQVVPTAIDSFMSKWNERKTTKVRDLDDGCKVITIDGRIDQHMFDKVVDQYEQCESSDPLVVRITTMGGQLTWAYMIARLLANHPADVQAWVPRYAMSAGTIIALSTNSIVLSHVGCLGPIDPRLMGLDVNQIVDAFDSTDMHGGDWLTLVRNYARPALAKATQDHATQVKKILVELHGRPMAGLIYDFFVTQHHHQTPIYADALEASELELKIVVDPTMLRTIRDWKCPEEKQQREREGKRKADVVDEQPQRVRVSPPRVKRRRQMRHPTAAPDTANTIPPDMMEMARAASNTPDAPPTAATTSTTDTATFTLPGMMGVMRGMKPEQIKQVMDMVQRSLATAAAKKTTLATAAAKKTTLATALIEEAAAAKSDDA